MSLQRTRFALPALTIAAMLSQLSCAPAPPEPPEGRRDETVERLHGREFADPYRWLEDPQSPQTRAWIESQKLYAQRVLADAPAAGALRQRMDELYRVDNTGVPIARAGRYFFESRGADQGLSALYLRRSSDGADQAIVDPQDLSSDGSISVDYASISPDGKLVAYHVRRGGEDETEVRFLDVDAAEHLPDRLPRGTYLNISIDGDGAGVFYDRHTDDGPRVFHHVFGTPPEADRVVFGRGYGAEVVITSQLSSNGRYLLLSVAHGAAASRPELYFLDTWAGTQVHTIVNDIDAAFEGHIAGDILFVLTDWEAPNRRVFAANLRRPAPDSWTEIIPEGDTPIESLVPAGGRLLVQRLDNVQPRLAVHEPDGFPVRAVPLPEIGALGGISGGTWESDEVFYDFSSLALPPTVYRYRVSDGHQQVWAETDAPVDTSSFVISQETYASADGTSIPMFVAHRRGAPRDGTSPALLTGVGGFNVSVLPGFDRFAVVWMENGGVWAMPSLRGGGELGADWHRAGMRENKQNVFDDFIAAAEWLIANEYTKADRLAIRGASNGGLLVGAALTQRPDLFAAVVCRYPLLDMLRYHRFPAAEHWVPEYGSADNPADLEYLARYSPYHRVTRGTRYPSVMLVAGDGDTRVAPLHARKMTALLQEATGSPNPVVLLYDDSGDHSRERPAKDVVEALTSELRFLLWRTRY